MRTPPPDCARCPRLVRYREKNRAAEPAWHNAPVPSFGPTSARLLVVGLAPGLKGANRTGRPFTGDYAGELLYSSLVRFGLARGRYGASPDDGLVLTDCRITNAVRCAPPENKPERPEILNCRPFLEAEIAAMPRLRAILALGRIAHDQTLAALGVRPKNAPFAHGALYDAGQGRIVAASYHCSRYNTQTGRLTPAMFRAVFAALRARLNGG